MHEVNAALSDTLRRYRLALILSLRLAKRLMFLGGRNFKLLRQRDGVFLLRSRMHVVGSTRFEFNCCAVAQVQHAKAKVERDAIFSHDDLVNNLVAHACQNPLHQFKGLADLFSELASVKTDKSVIK